MNIKRNNLCAQKSTQGLQRLISINNNIRYMAASKEVLG